MGVDLYVGTFSRYLAGDWQTEYQQLFAEAGNPNLVQVVHADGWQPLGREEALQRAIAWRDQAIAAAERDEPGLKGPIASWQEATDSPYEVKRLEGDGIAAVILALFYDDLKRLPSRVPDPLMSDPRLAAKKDDVDHSVAAMCLACDLWVPGEFALTHEFDWPRYVDGSQATVGSLGMLKKLLDQIERLRWPDLPQDLHDYAARGATTASTKKKGIWPFRRKAREGPESTFMLAVQTLDRMKAMTAIAQERNLPMIRDR